MLVVVIIVEVAQPPLHVMMEHALLQHAKLHMHDLAPECFARPPNFTVLVVVETRVADALQALGYIYTRKSDDRDHTTEALEVLVDDREDTHNKTNDLRLYHAKICVIHAASRFIPENLGAWDFFTRLDSCKRNGVNNLIWQRCTSVLQEFTVQRVGFNLD